MRINPRPSAEPEALRIAFEHVTNCSVAIDGGAYVGDWSAVMATRFEQVQSFEPAPDLIDGLRARFADTLNVQVFQKALWSEVEMVDLIPDPSHPLKKFGRHVRRGNEIEAVSIDSLALESCGLIKLDLEGAELHALHGAVWTIDRFRPVIICECKSPAAALYKATADEPGEFLADLGYREIGRCKPDRIYRWAP